MNYVVADHLGTPQVVSNSGGTPVWSTTYQPFGTTGLINASISQNLRFPGQYADVETGFSYNLNRDYMPNLGRYLETDQIGLAGGVDTYGYGHESPANNTDTEGKQAEAPESSSFEILGVVEDFLNDITAQRDAQETLSVLAKGNYQLDFTSVPQIYVSAAEAQVDRALRSPILRPEPMSQTDGGSTTACTVSNSGITDTGVNPLDPHGATMRAAPEGKPAIIYVVPSYEGGVLHFELTSSPL